MSRKNHVILEPSKLSFEQLKILHQSELDRHNAALDRMVEHERETIKHKLENHPMPKYQVPHPLHAVAGAEARLTGTEFTDQTIERLDLGINHNSPNVIKRVCTHAAKRVEDSLMPSSKTIFSAALAAGIATGKPALIIPA